MELPCSESVKGCETTGTETDWKGCYGLVVDSKTYHLSILNVSLFTFSDQHSKLITPAGYW